MKKRAIAILLILAMIFVPAAAFAGPPGPPPPSGRGCYRPGPPGPPPPPDHHGYRHDNDDWDHVAAGLGIAILLGTLIYNSSRHAAPQQPSVTPEQQKKADDARALARQNADAELQRAVALTASHDVAETLDMLDKRWRDDGRTTSIDAGSPVSALKVTGFVDSIVIDYIFDSAKATATVRVTSPNYQVSEESSGQYHVKPPLSSLQKNLGFDLADKYRSASGGIEIRGIVPDSQAAKAGIKEGDLLLKVDVYDVKNCDCGRISAYIEGRAERKAAVRLLISHQGKTRQVTAQLPQVPQI